MGIRSWEDDTTRLYQQILMPFPLKKSVYKTESKVGSGRSKCTGTWFCAAFQKKECSHKDSHHIDMNGKTLFAHHICTLCWLKDEVKAHHPDS